MCPSVIKILGQEDTPTEGREVICFGIRVKSVYFLRAGLSLSVFIMWVLLRYIVWQNENVWASPGEMTHACRDSSAWYYKGKAQLLIGLGPKEIRC